MSGPSGSQAQATAAQAIDYWLERVKTWYPHRQEKTYCVPEFYFRRQTHDVATVANQDILVPANPQACGKRLKPALYPSVSSSSFQSASSFSISQLSLSSSQSTCSLSSLQLTSSLSSSQSNSQLTSSLSSSQSQSPAGQVWTQQTSSPALLPHYIQSDEVDDNATELVLNCLKFLGDQQLNQQQQRAKRRKGTGTGMIIISQLQFKNYLDGKNDPNFALSAIACASLPRPNTMDPQDQCGDLDFLIVHSKCGLIALEVKAVGASHKNIPDLNRQVINKVGKSLKQLEKNEKFLGHVTSDMQQPVNVCKALVLTGITSVELRQALAADPNSPLPSGLTQLQQDLCSRLGTTPNLDDALKYCLCLDSLLTQEELDILKEIDETEASSSNSSSKNLALLEKKENLLKWWKLITENNGQRTLSSDDYDQLLARFCGPATTVEIPTVTAPRLAAPGKKNSFRKVVRTEGEAVAEAGLILSRLTLYPDQVQLLHDTSLTSLHLYGPPGTGKTVILVLKAIQWLHEGFDVILYSSSGSKKQYSCSPAIFFVIKEQLQQALHVYPPAGNNPGQVNVKHVNSYSDDCVKSVASLATYGKLHLLSDETNRDDFNFFQRLDTKVNELHVWCASVEDMSGRLPQMKYGNMQNRLFDTPLRTTPEVTKEIQRSGEFKKGVKRVRDPVRPYKIPSSKPATQGNPVKWLKHTDEPGHDQKVRSVECGACAQNIAEELANLHVGQPGEENLQYKDVFILVDPELLSSTMVFANELRNLRLPVKILMQTDTDDEHEEVGLARTDEITISDYSTLRGLERRVVIGLQKAKAVSGPNRLYAMSRSTSQLIWIR